MSKNKVGYKKLKLKAGLEIHQQLDTEHKLFCNCSTAMEKKRSSMTVIRRQHPVASELGEVDIATQYESMRNREFEYQVFSDEDCLVELDEEPPHALNEEALKIAIQIAMFLHCDIPSELHIMRKTITDGSNTGGFQRTLVVGRNGYIKHGRKKIEIEQVALEEDAAAIEKEKDDKVIYRLSRLGVPLVEISTGVIEDCEPEDIQEIAYLIGIICRSTESVKHGIGSIRQDVNVSINNGPRVEIKGVQELGLVSKVVEKEVKRQVKADEVKEETRAANPDGTTRFTRPLPGAARMYPETDVPPVALDKKWLKKIRSKLPEPMTEKLERFQKKMELSEDLAMQIIGSDYLNLFESITKRYRSLNPTVVANVFTSTIVELRRKNVEVGKLGEDHFMKVFSALAKDDIVKEAIPDILIYLTKNPKDSVSKAIKKLNLTMLGRRELKKVIKTLVEDSPDAPFKKLYGIAMSRVRGRADPQEVREITEMYFKKKK